MGDLLRCMKSDFYKLRHTWTLWMHLLAPFMGAAVFLAYYAVSGWSASTKVSCYFEAVAIAFPLTVGLICSMVVSQEEQAGNFQELTARTKWKGTAFLSKLLMLVLGALFSIVVAFAVFGMGLQHVLHQQNLPVTCYVQAGAGLFAASVLLYAVHLHLSLKFGKGASIGLGIVGSLISAIMITGLGDATWKAMPWGWGVRFCDYAVLFQKDPAACKMFQGEIHQGIMFMTLEGCIGIMAALIWFCRFEGRKSCE